ncbi:hypothetical protein KFK09_019440 [Dendrobium nobile]|uniref:Uncharacterized protein n=1 Tax=Dendrobium nobile TaxID=94219 RepID=A0A8T3AS54_DENNO|nr:hypothetical protein KFK09_019440 [Dendrobium nobile]
MHTCPYPSGPRIPPQNLAQIPPRHCCFGAVHVVSPQILRRRLRSPPIFFYKRETSSSPFTDTSRPPTLSRSAAHTKLSRSPSLLPKLFPHATPSYSGDPPTTSLPVRSEQATGARYSPLYALLWPNQRVRG